MTLPSQYMHQAHLINGLTYGKALHKASSQKKHQSLKKKMEDHTTKSTDRRRQRHVVLVHGACHGGWCWYKTAAALRSAGHRVTAPDLAASGIDGGGLDEISTFEEYSRPLLELLAALPEGERAVLVGHSLGGLSVALCMERFPERVEAAVFAAAVMPDCVHHPYYPLGKLFERHPSAASGFLDTEFSVVETPAKGQITAITPGPQFLAKIYSHCSSEDLAMATSLVRPGSMFEDGLKGLPPMTVERYGSVPSFYIVCREDEQIPEEHQRWMAGNHPVEGVAEVDAAGHMVMLARPNELCQSILRIVDRLS